MLGESVYVWVTDKKNLTTTPPSWTSLFLSRTAPRSQGPLKFKGSQRQTTTLDLF